MTLRHSLLIALLVLSYAPISTPSASASPLTAEPSQQPQRQSRKRVPPKSSKKAPKKAPKAPKKSPLGGGGGRGGGGNSGGGSTGGGTTTGGTTTNNNAGRRRRGRRRGNRRGNRRQQGRQLGARKGGRKKANKARKPKGIKQAAPAPVEEPIFVDSRFEQEEGVLGTTPPQPVDVLVEDRPVHADRYGHAARQLLALDGHPEGGFAAAWIDQRDDSPQVYVGRFDQDGSSLEPERPAALDSAPVAGSEAELDLGAGGSGTLFWSPPAESGNRLRLRSFESDGGFAAPERPTGPPWAGPASADPSIGPMRLARRPDGSAVIVSRRAGEVSLTELDVSGRQIGKLETISKGHFEAKGDPVVTAGPTGVIFVSWPSKQGIVVWKREGPRGDARQRVIGFKGIPLDLAFDVPTANRGSEDLGAWVLYRETSGLRLLRVDGEFAPQGRPLAITAQDFDRAELVTWGPGPAVLVEADDGGSIDSLKLHVMLQDGRLAGAPIDVLPAGVAAARGARLAATMDRVMVAWTDAREGTSDVYARVFERDRSLSSTEVRLTTDQNSASQDQPAIASDEAREQAVMVWTDRRDGVARVYARRVSEDGSLAPVELSVPATAERNALDQLPACSRPVVAVDSDGRFLVVWKEEEADHHLIRAQAFGSDDEPLGPPFELDPGFDSSRVIPAGVVALRQESGWAVLWDREGEGVRLAHVAADGEMGIRHIEMAEAPEVGSLAMCLLDDSRLASVWSTTEVDPKEGKPEIVVRGRLLTLDLRTAGLEVELGVVSDFAGGLAMTRSRNGGFALTWNRGEETERDVMVGFFDRYGLPASPPIVLTPERGSQRDPSITRLADHSWVVAWQDDISGTDLVHARRVRFDPIRLGPTFTVNQVTSARNEARRSPEIAALGDGFVATWIDARRSLGADVFARVLGPGFDGVIWSETGRN